MVNQVVVEEHLAANLHAGVGEEDNRMVEKPDSQDKSQVHDFECYPILRIFSWFIIIFRSSASL